MTKKESLTRFIRISKADTPLRRLYDRICGEAVLIAILCAAFFGVGYCIHLFVERSAEILTRVIDWCGFHPFVPSITIALMIGACVVADVRCGK